MGKRRNASSPAPAPGDEAEANQEAQPKKKNWRQPTGNSTRITRSAAAAAAAPPAPAPAPAPTPAPAMATCSSSETKAESEQEPCTSRDETTLRRQRKKLRGAPIKIPPGGALIVSFDAAELVRVKKQIKYFFNNMSKEQSMIDAYSNEGWKGNNREKVKPVRELANAQARIMKLKLKIREAIQELDKMCLEGSILDSAFDDDGQLDYQEIFCARCHSREVEVDNDIVLCDGCCNRGFHQQCLVPPLATEEIPPGEDGWICPVCDCKSECVSFLNERLGTDFEVETKAEDFFPDAVQSNGNTVAAADLPSDESDDDDYDPESKEAGAGAAEEKQAQANGEDDDKEDEDEDDEDEDEEVNESGGSSDDDQTDLSGEEPLSGAEDEIEGGDEGEGGEAGADDALSDANGDGGAGVSTTTGKRRRREVDYRKLHDEMFGLGFEWEVQSEDEDYQEFGPESKRPPKKSSGPERRILSRKVEEEYRFKRIPLEAVKRLKQAFEKDQLPSRGYKEKLSKELGLSYNKIDIWYKNVRKQASKALKQKEAENKVLLTQLGEAEVKLEKLVKAMDGHQIVKLSPHLRGFEHSVVDASRGKRLVYVPVAAQVVEKSV